jgi:hypothetical protein
MNEDGRVGLAGLRMARGRNNSGRWLGDACSACSLQKLSFGRKTGKWGGQARERVPNYILHSHRWPIYYVVHYLLPT